jgi:hypothetical protein
MIEAAKIDMVKELFRLLHTYPDKKFNSIIAEGTIQ